MVNPRLAKWGRGYNSPNLEGVFFWPAKILKDRGMGSLIVRKYTPEINHHPVLCFYTKMNHFEHIEGHLMVSLRVLW